MGQISMEIMRLPGSLLSRNQQRWTRWAARALPPISGSRSHSIGQQNPPRSVAMKAKTLNALSSRLTVRPRFAQGKQTRHSTAAPRLFVLSRVSPLPISARSCRLHRRCGPSAIAGNPEHRHLPQTQRAERFCGSGHGGAYGRCHRLPALPKRDGSGMVLPSRQA
jgi:hypothetical protein